MDNLVKRLERNSGWRNERWQCVTDPALLTEAAARITALETSLAEAEGRVIADVVAWLNNASIWLNGGECCGQKCSDGVCCAPACIWGDELKLLHSVATALETGEWRNAQSV